MKIEYHNIYIHLVLTTKNRQALLLSENRIRIEKYITGIINNNGCQLYAIYANPEHIHILLSKSPEIDETTLIEIIGKSSRDFINNNNLCRFKFEWQQSCSVFSVSKGDVDKVCKYILNQEKHHKKKTFAEEYDAFIQFYQKTLVLK